MRLSPLSLLPFLATSTEIIHTKQIQTPFSDDPYITILSPLNTNVPPSHRRLQEDNSNDASLLQDLRQSSTTTNNKCDSSQSLWSLTLLTDNFPSQTSWTLKQVSTNELMIAGPPSNVEYTSNTSYNGEICILTGMKYVFRIIDEGGDGMCCDESNNGNKGGFTMSVDGKVFVDKMNVDEEWGKKSYLFHVGTLDTSSSGSSSKPTNKPSRKPSPKPTVWEVPTIPTELSMPPVEEGAIPTPMPTEGAVDTYKPTTEPEEGVAVSFILMGDIPYYTNHKYCLNQQLRALNPAEMDYPYSFIVHVGDLKSGQSVDCVNEYYTDVADIFSSPLNTYHYDTRDVFFLIGDNDWCDCNDPGSAFSYWMNSFGNGNKYNWINKGPNPNGFGTFSTSNLRQSLEYDDDGSDSSSSYYPSSASNFAFFINKVLFIGLNQVGGAELGDESTRVRNNFLWTKSKMEQYAQQDMRTLVIFAHAAMSGARWEYFGQPFQALLQNSYPDMLVLYAHGDGHEFNLDRIDRYNPNLYQMECDSGDLGDPLLISIMRSGSERDGLNVDRRGGTYYGGDCAPDNRDKTWSSDMF